MGVVSSLFWLHIISRSFNFFKNYALYVSNPEICNLTTLHWYGFRFFHFGRILLRDFFCFLLSYVTSPRSRNI